MDEALPHRVPAGAETPELSPGLRASDLLELPKPLSSVLHWMMRQQEPISLAETEAFLNKEGEQTASLLGELCERGFVRAIEIDGVLLYRVRLAPRRGRKLPPSLWEAWMETMSREERSVHEMGSSQTDSRLESELEIARRIQASFLPEALPEFPGWEIAARFQPARHVSGDFYDAFPLIQNRRLALVIGDVCDKGVGAALFMALFRTLIRAFAQQHYALRWMKDSSVEALFRRPMAEGRRPTLPSTGSSALINAMELTNEYIVSTHRTSGMFATLFVGVLDPKSGQLLFANGGHEYPILVNSTGIKSRLDTTGPLVGVFPGAQFELQSVDIEPGDILVACTDGVTEARSSNDEFFGRERLYALMEQPASTADELLDRIQASVQEHMNGAEPSDDITLLAVRRQ